MTMAGPGSAGGGLGWWQKVLLWTLVLVFGVLYLGSVKRNPGESVPTLGHGGGLPVLPEQSQGPSDLSAQGQRSQTDPTGSDVPEEAAPERVAPEVVASEVVVPEAAAPEADASGAGATQAREPLLAAAPSPEMAEGSEPTRAVESAAFADSLLSQETEEGTREGPQSDTPQSASSSASSPKGGQRDVAPSAGTAGVSDGSEGMSGRVGDPLRAGEESGAMPSVDSVATAATPMASAPGPEAGDSRLRQAVPAQSPSDHREAERARILSEYQALWRDALELPLDRRQPPETWYVPPPRVPLEYGYGPPPYFPPHAIWPPGSPCR